MGTQKVLRGNTKEISLPMSPRVLRMFQFADSFFADYFMEPNFCQSISVFIMSPLLLAAGRSEEAHRVAHRQRLHGAGQGDPKPVSLCCLRGRGG